MNLDTSKLDQPSGIHRMGTLEIRDPDGRIQFVMLSQEHPIVFGGSPTCDLVLTGPEVFPVNGRIRWKRTKFRVEASPDAEFVLVNGNRMTSTSFYPSDEVTVGGWTIRLLDGNVEDQADSQREASQEREHLHISSRVSSSRESEKRTPGPSTGNTTRKPSSAKKGSAKPKLEDDDWLQLIKGGDDEIADEDELEFVDEDELVDDSALETALFPNKVGAERTEEQEPVAQETPKPLLTQGLSAKKPSPKPRRLEAPGEESLISSPLVIGLFASFAVLVLLGITIYTVLTQTVATRLYNHAVEALDSGDYRNAIRDFDLFLESNPRDSRVDKARTLRGLANVRQYVSPGGGMWTNALEAARKMFDELRDLPEFGDERAELGETIVRIGEGLADRARASTERKALNEAESVLPLLREVAGEGAKAAIGRSNLTAKLNEARAANRKAEFRTEMLAAMDESLKGLSSRGVYAARDRLVGQYSDLANDRELLKRMVSANELVRKAVKVSTKHVPGVAQPRQEVLGSPVGLVLRSSAVAAPATPVVENITFSFADGFAFGIDGETGAVLWQTPVGLASPFAPLGVPSDPSCLVVDARHQELMRLNSLNGKLIWRQSLSEPVDDPPFVLGNQLIQVLPSGRMLIVALDSGDVQAVVDVGFPLSRAPIADESGRNLYLLAKRDCLLVFSRDPLACVTVEYLGHPEGSIPCPPARVGRFLIVPENYSLTDGRWRVFVLDPDGSKLKAVQEIPIAGWTWTPPAVAGSIVWSATDRGALEAFSVGEYTSSKPFQSVSRLDGEIQDNGPSYTWARSERELWVASRHGGRYDLNTESGVISPKLGLSQTGPAIAPIRESGNNLILTFKDPITAGTAVWAVDPESGKTVWRTLLGTSWTATPRQTSEGNSASLLTVGIDGRPAEIPRSLLDSGGLVSLALPASGTFSLPSEPFRWIKSGDRELLVPDRVTKDMWVRDPNAPADRPWRRVDLPASMSAVPLIWGGGLLIPGADARVYIVDPATARSIIEPFVPVYDRERPTEWLDPSAIDAENLILADRSGRIRKLSLKAGGSSRLTVEVERSLDQQPTASPVATTQTVVIATADHQIRALATRDLSPIGSWSHRGSVTSIPPPSQGRIFVPDDTAGLLALATDGRRLWSTELESRVVGTPLVLSDRVWFVTLDGILHGRDLETGAALEKMNLNVLPFAGPLALVNDKNQADRLIIPVGRGTYQTIKIPKPGERKP